jgi:hypothetical protein
MLWDKLGERREGESVHDQQVYGGALNSCSVSRYACLMLLLHVVAYPGAAPSYTCGRSNECLQHLAHAWEMRTQNYSERLPTSRAWLVLYVR